MELKLYSDDWKEKEKWNYLERPKLIYWKEALMVGTDLGNTVSRRTVL